MKTLIATMPLVCFALCISIGLTTGCSSPSSPVKKNPPFFAEEDSKKIEIDLNIEKGALFDIVPFFSEWLNFDYIIFSDTTNYKPVTVILKGEYSKQELWNRFLKILEASKAKCTSSGRKVRIYPLLTELP